MDTSPTIRDLYPHLSDEELQKAEESLEQYLALGLRMFDRICAEPGGYEELLALTKKKRMKYDD